MAVGDGKVERKRAGAIGHQGIGAALDEQLAAVFLSSCRSCAQSRLAREHALAVDVDVVRVQERVHNVLGSTLNFFYSSLTVTQNNLERLFLTKFFKASLIFSNKARAYPESRVPLILE